jgi:hypothetical protein
MTNYQRLFGDDLRSLLNQYDGNMQNIEFMRKAGYLSEAEYKSLAARGIKSSVDLQGDLHDHLDLEGLDEIKAKEAELIGRIMSHKLGISYEEWSKPEADEQDQNELFEEILDFLKEAWWNDPAFCLAAYSHDRSKRVLINLVQESNDALYDEERPKIEVYRESITQSSSTASFACEDESYTWYFLDENASNGDGEIGGAVRDFIAQVEEIEGVAIVANGKEEQETDTLVSAIERFISSP